VANPGQRLGTTRSEKAIFLYFGDDLDARPNLISTYTASDHFDAFALLQYLISRQLRRLGRDAEFIRVFDRLAKFHYSSIKPEDFTAEMSTLSITTIFDIAKYGKSCADAIFQD